MTRLKLRPSIQCIFPAARVRASRNLSVMMVLALIIGVLAGCADSAKPDTDPAPIAVETLPPTPAADALLVRDTTTADARLRVTLPSVRVLNPRDDHQHQLFLALADPDGTYTYLLFPANRAGAAPAEFDLSQYPLEIGLHDDTQRVMLWVVAVHNKRYRAAERFGLDALAASLGIGFQTWLTRGDPNDDPLAAVVAASDGALFEWFANIEVVGQDVIALDRDANWRVGLDARRSADNGLNTVFTVQHILDGALTALPTATPPGALAGYDLRVDEVFAGGVSQQQWFEGQDSTYLNHLTNGAYEIQLTAIEQREFGLSWGSIEDARFEDYRLEAIVRLVEDDVVDGRYGIWFHYQDDLNFVYFGLSNRGEYRVAIIQRNKNRIEIQDWTPSPAIRPDAATNTLSVEANADGTIVLTVNGERLIAFKDDTFTGGSVAFFCYAESVPTTCRLERLRIWERTGE